jgi:hypothetical protein
LPGHLQLVLGKVLPQGVHLSCIFTYHD